MKNSFIDDITWNDLSLDLLEEKINTCKTSAGDYYINYRLRHPVKEKGDKFTEYIDVFKENDNIIKILSDISRLKKYEFNDCLSELEKKEKESNIIHYFCIILVIITFSIIFISPGFGFLSFFIALFISLQIYFNNRKNIAKEIYVFSYIIKLIKAAKKLSKEQIIINGSLQEEGAALKRIYEHFRPFMAGCFLLPKGTSTSGNIVDIALDYLRMIFHLDIIKYNGMVEHIKINMSEVKELFEIIGIIDALISVKNYRESLEYYCKPEFTSDICIVLNDAYHPLLNNPVANSIDTSRNVLLTGSNASGKSTFLKMVGINAIVAQSFGFAYATKYVAPFFDIYSSMALKDDITNGESYFMAEIKSLKRIADACESEETVLCIIDEVLRGTNTVERIAASSEILNKICGKNNLLFVATHDIELTSLLEDNYDNYHFTEEITEGDVKFSYSLYEGKATTRNAIKLLNLIGFKEEYIKAAELKAENFINNGIWRN